jgi:3-hydroxyacyl-CoA dehydrogenase/enoyl-CoA hydratase/3-hydroxybutyryl-CoA epimerase
MATKKKTSALSLTLRPDGVALVLIDVPGEAQNTLRAEFTTEFNSIVAQIEESEGVRAIVIASGKKGSFVAGADIEMIKRIHSSEEATRLSREGQAAMDRLEASPVPVVAAIDGACLGGGLELALACHARVASDEPHTKIGLPEVQLGLLPGAGGTQRLPRLIGIAKSLDLMLTGRQLSGSRAKKLGVVDEVVPASIVIEAACKRALKLADSRALTPSKPTPASLFASLRDVDPQELALEKNPIGRKILFREARKKLLEKSYGNYPAAERIVDVVEYGAEHGFQAGLAKEAEFFGVLVMTEISKQLRNIFFAMTALKRETGVDDETIKPRIVDRVGVLGAGLMGAGIAIVSVDKADVDVRIKDRDNDGLMRGMGTLSAYFGKKVKRRSLSPNEAARQLRRITTTTEYNGLRSCDVVIEAVFEDLALKHRVLRDVEAATGPDTIFATNTSSIPITKIAAGASRPHNVIGMHYFSPVEKMPLLEIIVTDQTSDEVTATCVELGKRQGKTVIVVRDGVGFYTSRILAPYMNEAAFCISEGAAIDLVDEALQKWGYPVGPCTLLDEVGVDVAAKVGPIMVDAFGERMAPPGTSDLLIKDGRLGRKNGRGLYLYDGKKKGGKKQVDPTVYDLTGMKPSHDRDPVEIAERCGLLMVNEAVMCMQEGILRSPRDGDIGAIFGLGFPPFRGGPFRYVDTEGAARIVARLERFTDRYGMRFTPCQLLVDMAKSGKRFHKD